METAFLIESSPALSILERLEELLSITNFFEKVVLKFFLLDVSKDFINGPIL